MPLTDEGRERIERAMQANRSLPLLCYKCGRRGILRWRPHSGYVPRVAHTCPGPWVLAGFAEAAR
jgi:hypothetical protein